MIFIPRYFILFVFQMNGAPTRSDLNVLGLSGIALLLFVNFVSRQTAKRINHIQNHRYKVGLSAQDQQNIICIHIQFFFFASVSRAMIKSKRLTRHPCLTPRCRGKGSGSITLVLTDEKRSIIESLYPCDEPCAKPKFLKCVK